jgi:putative transcriptional regulator
MTISSHPDIATLMTCSAGSTPEALCAVVTSHLAMCPECMDELTSMESIGVALFEKMQPVKIDANPAQVTPASGDETTFRGEHQRRPDSDVPRPLVEVIGKDLDALDWQRIATGIWNFTVPLTPHAKGDLRLIRLGPGMSLPEHSHQGEELILVLRGSYRNVADIYEAGDFAELDVDNKHSMIALQDGCILLIGNEAMPTFLSELT